MLRKQIIAVMFTAVMCMGIYTTITADEPDAVSQTGARSNFRKKAR